MAQAPGSVASSSLLAKSFTSTFGSLDDFIVWARRNRRHSWLFTDFVDARDVLRRIIYLRSRGYGARVIARTVFREHLDMGYVSYDSAVKRIQRLLKDLEGFFRVRRGHFSRGRVHISTTFRRKRRAFCSRSRGERDMFPPRLGRTERLVYSVLMEHGELGLRDIYNLLRVHGLSYRAVYMALYRLFRRGLVHRTYYHTYYLVGNFSDPVFVENARSGEFVIWSKKEHGYPLPLSSFLVKAAKEWYFGLSQIELSIYPRDKKLEELAKHLEERGWRLTVIYRDEENGLKIEHRFWDPDTPPAPAYYTKWLRLAKQATSLAYHVSEKTLRNVHGTGVPAASTVVVVGGVGCGLF